jgi:hypothetical protein
MSYRYYLGEQSHKLDYSTHYLSLLDIYSFHNYIRRVSSSGGGLL